MGSQTQKLTMLITYEMHFVEVISKQELRFFATEYSSLLVEGHSSVMSPWIHFSKMEMKDSVVRMYSSPLRRLLFMPAALSPREAQSRRAPQAL